MQSSTLHGTLEPHANMIPELYQIKGLILYPLKSMSALPMTSFGKIEGHAEARSQGDRDWPGDQCRKTLQKG